MQGESGGGMMGATIKLALGSLVVGCIVLALKTLAWWLTGSVALLSDALESTVNIAAALAALVAIRIADIPPDENHPYGHHKAEFMSAVLEGVLIVIAALLILKEAWGGFTGPHLVNAPLRGLAINMLATALNGVWAWVLISRGGRLRSPALKADGRHLLADVVTSLGVALGVGLAVLTGWWVLDPLMAVVVAVNILWSGSRVIRESLSGLMDEAASEGMQARMRAVIAEAAGGAMEAHALRTRHAGRVVFIDFHLVVPDDTTVYEAHAICDRIEAALRRAVPGAKVTIHVEPEHEAQDKGVIVID